MDKSLSGVGVLGCLATLGMPLLSRFGFVARPVWLFWLLRWHPRYAFVLQASLFGVLAFALAPRFVSVLHASPLCGAAPTFLCRRKEK
ncbi:hypothetical protein [Paraburkholderia steynii]|uniref:hypothetical protein n=1 Tax=Paraburkholderia steynii TaxID=1245441 RepID=UPI00115FCF18|nr:hypothetical protein [Paraburkholderia steynii]